MWPRISLQPLILCFKNSPSWITQPNPLTLPPPWPNFPVSPPYNKPSPTSFRTLRTNPPHTPTIPPSKAPPNPFRFLIPSSHPFLPPPPPGQILFSPFYLCFFSTSSPLSFPSLKSAFKSQYVPLTYSKLAWFFFLSCRLGGLRFVDSLPFPPRKPLYLVPV